MNIIRNKVTHVVMWLSELPIEGADGVFVSDGMKIGLSSDEHEALEAPMPEQTFFAQCMSFNGSTWTIADQSWYDQCWAGYCAEHNAKQKAARAAAYPVEADPLFFKFQRGEVTQGEWIRAVDGIKARFPYIGLPTTPATEPTVEGAQTL